MVNADVEGDRLSVRNARTCGLIYAVIAAADDKGRPYFWTLIARKKEMLGLLNCLLSAGEVLSPL